MRNPYDQDERCEGCGKDASTCVCEETQNATRLMDMLENQTDNAQLYDEASMARENCPRSDKDAFLSLLSRIDEGFLNAEAVATFDRILGAP